VNEPSTFVALHHVRVPVSDVLRSRDWYTDVLGFAPRLTFEDRDSVIGVVVDHPSGLTLGLHQQPDLARALRGFCCLALDIGSAEDLARWCRRLDAMGISHSEPDEGHLGWYVAVPDPDGLLVYLHTTDQPSADEA
jgi:catechol 2,3-dioxygenase-like lactoylglutathione lyase family enzyme